MKQKNKKTDFSVCYYVGASLLGNLLTSKGIIRAGKDLIREGEVIIRAGQNF